VSGAFKGRSLEIWLVSIKLGKGHGDLNWMNKYPPDNGGVVNIPLSNELFESPTRTLQWNTKRAILLSYPLHEKIFSKSKVWDRFSFCFGAYDFKSLQGVFDPLAQVFFILGMEFGLVQVAHVYYDSSYKST
jgi:hypothetical protein